MAPRPATSSAVRGAAGPHGRTPCLELGAREKKRVTVRQLIHRGSRTRRACGGTTCEDRPAPSATSLFFTKTSHGRRCRRGHHGTDRTTHVLPWAGQRRPGPLRDPEPLIANESEVSVCVTGLPAGDSRKRVVSDSPGCHLRSHLRSPTGRNRPVNGSAVFGATLSWPGGGSAQAWRGPGRVRRAPGRPPLRVREQPGTFGGHREDLVAGGVHGLVLGAGRGSGR